MKIAVLLNDLGPYHHARLKKISKKHQLLVIESLPAQKGLAYERVTDQASYQCVGLDQEGWRSRMFRALQEFRPEVLALTGWSQPRVLAGMAWAQKYKVPQVMMSDSRENDDGGRSWLKGLKKILLSGCSAAFCAGAPHRRWLEKLGMKADRIFDAYDTVDNAWFKAGALRARKSSAFNRKRLSLPKSYIVCPARMLVRKGHVHLLKAYKSLGSASPALVLLGQGPAEEDLRHWCNKNSLEDKVIFKPFAAYKDMPTILGLAKIVVLPSLSDQWGLVVNEAMACQVPVVVSEGCGCHEDLAGEGAALSYPAENSKALKDCLQSLLKSKSLTKKTAKTGYLRIQAWDLKHHARNFEKAAGLALAEPRFNPVAGWMASMLSYRGRFGE